MKLRDTSCDCLLVICASRLCLVLWLCISVLDVYNDRMGFGKALFDFRYMSLHSSVLYKLSNVEIPNSLYVCAGHTAREACACVASAASSSACLV